MKQAQFLLSVLMLIALNVNAQQDNNWHFGRMSGLNFSTGKPEAITNSTMSTMEGSASISDMNGDILFYTDGISVWNRYNQKMPNGTGLLGDQSTTQAAIIIPKPGSKTRYYIFVGDDAGGLNGLTYSEVDMLADNGKGDVISANTPLITPISEKIAGVFHANGTDIWVTTHHWGSNAFYSYKVTALGVDPQPVVSNAGLLIDGATNSGHYAGWMSISPDGKKLASASSRLAIELFDFDNQTGKVSNAVTLKTPAKCYGAEFSPNSKLLYVTSDNAVLQYQINTADVAATETNVGTIDVASSVKLGPDSKIYVVNKYLSGSLSVINSPDTPGTGCDFALNTIDLGGKQTFIGLPNFLTSPYYLLDINAKNDCTDTAVTFEAISTLDNETVSWDFGDGNHSTDSMVTHTYITPGKYTVNVKTKKGDATRYFSKQITILEAPVAETPADMFTCSTPEGNGVFNLTEQNASILGNQPANMFTISYHITQQDADAGSDALPFTYTSTSDSQIIYARITRNNGACYDITSFTITVAPSPILNMEDSYSFCEGSYMVLTAPQGFDSYTWTYNGKSENSSYQRSVSKPGIYTLTVTKKTGNIICDVTKDITISESEKPAIRDIEVNDWTDSNNSISVVIATSGNYEYSLDGTIYQDSSLFENLEPGHYTIKVRDKDGCGEAEGEAVVLMYPKFFTPNDDGIHDKWQVKHAWFAPDTAITVLDRYGRIITSFTGNSSGWDGTFNGNELPASDYWFIIKQNNGKEYKGHFSMLR